MTYQGIPPATGGGGDASGYAGERWTVAVDRCPTLNRFASTEMFNTTEFFLGGGAGKAPVVDATVTGGVYRTPDVAAATAGWCSLGVTDNVKLIAAPVTESWYISARVKNPASATVTAAKFVIPIGLVCTDGALYIGCTQAQSATIFQADMFSGATSHYNALGSVATIGASTCPVGAFFEVAAWFNSTDGVLGVEFSDTLAADYSGAELTNMPTGVASVIVGYSSDATLALQIDACFAAWVAPT
jgi:hypothetical protein